MPEVLLAAPAEDEFRSLTPSQRVRALEVLRQLGDMPGKFHPRRVRSELLDTMIFLIEPGTFRMVYEVDSRRQRVIVLRIQRSRKQATRKHSHNRSRSARRGPHAAA